MVVTNVMKNNSSECGVLPCNFRDFKLTLEMAECVISPTLAKDLATCCVPIVEKFASINLEDKF